MSAESIITRIEGEAGRPLRAMIEVSDHCNEVCVHCYQEQGLKGEMTTEQVKAVIDDLAQLGILMLTFSGGEATLRKDLLELIAHARARGFSVSLFTNGLTMTSVLARALADLAVRLVEISIYSHRAEVHDFVTGVPGSFEKTVAGVRHLVAAGVDTHIKTNALSVNENELHEYAEFARQLGVTFGINSNALMSREARDRAPQAFDRSQEAYRRVQSDPRLTGSAARKSTWPERSPDSSLCGAGRYVLVEPNGEIRPCTMLHLDLGDAARGELRSYTQQEPFKQLRSLRWSDAHGCRDCDLRHHCLRCHAQALAEVGDALAPYPSGCAQTRVRYELATGATASFGHAGAASAPMGPYRRVAEHGFEPFADEVTSEDDALAARLGWIRRPAGGLPAAAAARPGTLVQLRRPGRARPRLEHVPEAETVVAADIAANSIAAERGQRTG